LRSQYQFILEEEILYHDQGFFDRQKSSEEFAY
jgi:hypothetical protein